MPCAAQSVDLPGFPTSRLAGGSRGCDGGRGPVLVVAVIIWTDVGQHRPHA